MASSKQLDIRSLSAADYDDWQTLVDANSRSTAYHTMAWKRAIENSMGYTPEFRLLYDGTGELVAGVPGFTTPEPFGRSVTNPFCEYGYPLVADTEQSEVVLQTIKNAYEGRSSVILKDSLRSGVRGYSPTGYAAVRTGVTYELPTRFSFEYIWEHSFNSDVRSNVRTACDSDLALRSEHDIETYYHLYLQTMSRLGSPPFPQSFFEELADQFDKNTHIFLAEDNSATVAGLLCIDHDGVRHVFSNVSDPASLDKYPNEYLYHHAVKSACEGTIKRVDFGRTDPHSELALFKAKFGATDSPLMSLVSPPRFITRASISEYKKLEPITRILSPILTDSRIGPHIKRWIHE